MHLVGRAVRRRKTPDGSGAGSPIIGWDASGTGSDGRTYTIALTGATYFAVPEPGTFLVLGVGVSALAAGRRKK